MFYGAFTESGMDRACYGRAHDRQGNRRVTPNFFYIAASFYKCVLEDTFIIDESYGVEREMAIEKLIESSSRKGRPSARNGQHPHNSDAKPDVT